ncbi:MAG: hypothetical protein IPM16_19210 [Chloroflexi bacterium]|nr:hypothetical protein [Chloroflexota bacterium]
MRKLVAPPRIACVTCWSTPSAANPHRQIILPTGYDIAWQDGAVIILELGRRLELADWTFSVLDTVTGERQPVLRVTTANTVQMRITEFDLHHADDGYYGTLYVPFTGDVWVSSPGAPDAVKLATVTRGLTQPLAWSPDRSMLAIKAEQVVVLHRIGADGTDYGPLTVPRTTAVSWSPDSRTILLNPVDPRLAELEGAALVDAASGAITRLPDIRQGTWCGESLAALEVEPRLSLLNLTSGGREVLADYRSFGDLTVSSVEVLDDACRRMLVGRGHLADGFLVQRDTGSVTRIGSELRVIHVTDTTLTYQTRVDEQLTVQRLRFDAPSEPELLAAFSRLYVPVIWLPGGERGIALDFRTLILLDIAADSAIPLSDQIVLGFGRRSLSVRFAL